MDLDPVDGRERARASLADDPEEFEEKYASELAEIEIKELELQLARKRLELRRTKQEAELRARQRLQNERVEGSAWAPNAPRGQKRPWDLNSVSGHRSEGKEGPVVSADRK